MGLTMERVLPNPRFASKSSSFASQIMMMIRKIIVCHQVAILTYYGVCGLGGCVLSGPRFECARACALSAPGLLLADGVLTVGWGKTFWRIGRVPTRKRA